MTPEQFRDVMASRSLVAVSALTSAWPTVSDLPRSELTTALMDLVPAITDSESLTAAALAADWYDSLRELQLPSAPRFSARPIPPPPTSRYLSLVDWATYAQGSELSRLTGGMVRIVTNSARDTITTAVATDPAKPSFRRVARPGACRFCRMLAGRDNYPSEQAARVVVGRNGGRRGSRPLGSTYHDACHCGVAPVFH